MAPRASRQQSVPVRGRSSTSYLDAEGIALAKTHGVWLDMDIYNGDWIEKTGTKQGWPAEYLRKNRETTDIQRQGFAAAVKSGAKLTFGTDAAVYPYGLGGLQFAYMVRYGMTPMQAIQAATTEAAKALRKEGEVGTVRAGAWGDLIAVRSDPLADIRALEQVDAVVKGGELVR
jgi:imidazolonepropionase-like amidohydrolase